MLKVRTEPGGAETDESSGGNILGRIGVGQCVIALASSGDWLQVRYKDYEAAWMLMVYRERRLLAPLSDVHPGVVIVVAAEGRGKHGVRGSPFPMPPEVLQRAEEQAAAMREATAMGELV